ncbi:hypothetical protein IGJ02_001965 [Enterococcus sp. DIV0724b]|uniref:sulfite exporter TauE/SafE family protein n=1 Tax=Enterococcus sp. DIV0724b TaxID=2774694 RepID=UPI003D2FDB1E
MGIYLIYFIIVLLSNTVGAISGMGGGVIIKPMLDAVGYHSLQQIVLYSSIAVFTMSISSTIKQVKSGTKINIKEIMYLSVGAIVGGYVGNNVLDSLLKHNEDSHVLALQIFITIITLGLSLIYVNMKQFHFYCRKSLSFLLAGLFLGTISALLGIGGGPINVALLTLCFGFSIKQATVYSIATIFFAQSTQLLTSFSKGDFYLLDIRFLAIILPAALLGGYLGGTFNKNLSEKSVSYLYSGTIIIVLLLNVYNLISIYS